MGAIHIEPSDARRRVGNSRFSKEFGSKVKKDWEGNQPTAEKTNKSNQSKSEEQSMEEGNIEQGEAKHLVGTSGSVQLSYKTSQ